MTAKRTPEAEKARNHAYHAAHHDEINARHRARRAKPEVKAHDYAVAQEWSRRNPESVRLYNEKKAKKRAAIYMAYKDTLACTHCGLTGGHFICFHHMDATIKEANIGVLAQIAFDTPKFWAEVTKCIPLCHNCHALLHHKLDHPEG